MQYSCYSSQSSAIKISRELLHRSTKHVFYRTIIVGIWKAKYTKLNSHFQFNEKEKKKRVIGGLLKQFISNSGKRNDILQNSSVLMIKYCMFARINSNPSASFMNNGLLCSSASFFFGHSYQDEIWVCFCSLSMYSFSR